MAVNTFFTNGWTFFLLAVRLSFIWEQQMLGVYGHTTPDMQEVAVSAMSDFFAKAREAALKAASE